MDRLPGDGARRLRRVGMLPLGECSKCKGCGYWIP